MEVIRSYCGMPYGIIRRPLETIRRPVQQTSKGNDEKCMN